jgi:hypothetical protein
MSAVMKMNYIIYLVGQNGEKNHPLIELSESLPLSAYQKDMD